MRFAHLASLSVLGALLSGFMNNVGALALLMPVALSTARRHGYSPGLLLMPLSFATLLGGMMTLIGTPPNLLISARDMAESASPDYPGERLVVCKNPAPWRELGPPRAALLLATPGPHLVEAVLRRAGTGTRQRLTSM